MHLICSFYDTVMQAKTDNPLRASFSIGCDEIGCSSSPSLPHLHAHLFCTQCQGWPHI